MTASSSGERVVRFVRELGVARNRDFESAGIHPQHVANALNAGIIVKVGRGTYSLPGRSRTHREKIVEACKRIPNGTVCLLSALWFHGMTAQEPPALWMAIDTKARTPNFDSFPIELVYASGEALTHGAMNLGLDGVQISVTSPMKTVADCFKYADKVGVDLGPAALAAAVASNKYNRQRLLRFAELCRVRQAVTQAEKARMKRELNSQVEAQEGIQVPIRVWDRETLAKEVWEQPIRQLAKRYGTSDVAIHKHCKKMGIALPGRGYWAKQGQ